MGRYGALIAAGFIVLCSYPAANAQESSLVGHERRAFGQAGGWIILKTSRPDCWMMQGYKESLYGISHSTDRGWGLLITTKEKHQAYSLNLLVGLKMALTDSHWQHLNLTFENRGTTNGVEYVYEAQITKDQLAQIFSNKWMSVSGFYKTEYGSGQFSQAYELKFNDDGTDVFDSCIKSVR